MIFDILKSHLSWNNPQNNWKLSNIKSIYWNKFLVSLVMLWKGDKMMHASHYKIPSISVEVTAKTLTDSVKLLLSYSACSSEQYL